MKKNYVKPMATNLAFALNENIATSGFDVTEGHLKFNSEPGLNSDNTCNTYFGNTMIPSGLDADVSQMSFYDFVITLAGIRERMTNDEFAKLTGIEDPTNFEVAFTCWGE